MHRLLLAACLFLSSTAMAQQVYVSDYDKVQDPKNEWTIYKGQFGFEDLQKERTFDWFSRGASGYKPDTTAVKYLKARMAPYEMVVLMGTWCDDSHTQIPRLYKTLTAASFPMSRVTMYGVDRGKQAKNVEHKIYSLDKVPTIILYRNHQEVGRIVESPKKSIEADLAAMIKAKEEPSEE